MKCPFCRNRVTEVFNSRSTKFGTQIWRRRRCASCGKSFTSYEAVDLGFLQIDDGSKRGRTYSRAKLFSSVYEAFTDIAAKPEVIDAVTATVETRLLDLKQAVISTQTISETVLQTLKHYSTGAFIRYLSRQTTLANEAQLRKELRKY